MSKKIIQTGYIKSKAMVLAGVLRDPHLHSQEDLRKAIEAVNEALDLKKGMTFTLEDLGLTPQEYERALREVEEK